MNEKLSYIPQHCNMSQCSLQNAATRIYSRSDGGQLGPGPELATPHLTGLTTRCLSFSTAPSTSQHPLQHRSNNEKRSSEKIQQSSS